MVYRCLFCCHRKLSPSLPLSTRSTSIHYSIKCDFEKKAENEELKWLVDSILLRFGVVVVAAIVVGGSVAPVSDDVLQSTIRQPNNQPVSQAENFRLTHLSGVQLWFGLVIFTWFFVTLFFFFIDALPKDSFPLLRFSFTYAFLLEFFVTRQSMYLWLLSYKIVITIIHLRVCLSCR